MYLFIAESLSSSKLDRSIVDTLNCGQNNRNDENIAFAILPSLSNKKSRTYDIHEPSEIYSARSQGEWIVPNLGRSEGTYGACSWVVSGMFQSTRSQCLLT